MYKIENLVENLQLEIVSKSIDITGINMSGVYIGDLLSWVMGNIKPGDAWITIQTHVNIVAVAALGDASCIIIPENAEIDESTIQKSEEQNIPIFRSNLTAYELACKISRLIDEK